MDTHSIQLRKGVSPVIGEIAQDLMEADRLKGKQLRENSVLSYRSDLKDLERYCVDRGFDLEFPVSVDVIRGYVGSRSRTHKKSTLERRLSGITKAHKLLGYKSPCKTDEVRMIMQGLGNDRDHKKTKAKALTMENLVPILAVWEGDDLHSIRNRALLLVGYAIASRQSELSRLAVDDLEFVDKGVIIDKRMTKTDKDNKGQIVGVSYVPDRNLCAVRALRLWLESAGITSGKVFRGIKCGGKIIRDKADRNGFMLHPRS